MLVKASTDLAMRAGWTEPGRAESARTRGMHADKLARQLQNIRDELLERRGCASLAAIAESATAQGLLTSRGGPIRLDTVSRALKRLDQE
jgi:hypothetical protein